MLDLEPRIDAAIKEFSSMSISSKDDRRFPYLKPTDRAYLIKRAKLFRELDDKFNSLDPIKDYGERNNINYKRKTIRNDFAEFLSGRYFVKNPHSRKQ